jgi:hypothetical protein
MNSSVSSKPTRFGARRNSLLGLDKKLETENENRPESCEEILHRNLSLLDCFARVFRAILSLNRGISVLRREEI